MSQMRYAPPARLTGPPFASGSPPLHSRARSAFISMTDLEGQRLDLHAALANPAPETHLYVCGPAGLIETVLAAAKVAGWPDAHVHREFFTPPLTPIDQTDSGAFQVKLASTGQVFEVPQDKSIVAVLAEHGIEVPTSCEQGVCGTCLTRVLEGLPVSHRDFFLSSEQNKLINLMAICCSRARTRMLLLDL